jgi:hypothetical protein
MRYVFLLLLLGQPALGGYFGDRPSVWVLQPVPRCVVLKASVYHATGAQTDATPLLTADNSLINTRLLKSGKLKWVALSRDMFSMFTFGDTIRFYAADHRIDGEWIVRDKMNARYKRAADFLTTPDHRYTLPEVSFVHVDTLRTRIHFKKNEKKIFNQGCQGLYCYPTRLSLWKRFSKTKP